MDNKNINTPIEELRLAVDETLNLTYNYIDNAIGLIEKLSESFYQNLKDEAWNTLIDLFEGIEWILTTMAQIDSIQDLGEVINDHMIWNEYAKEVKEFMEMIKEMEKAVKDEEHKTIGDILMYKIVASFKNMKFKLKVLKPIYVNVN